jgi:nitrogen regulatory protein P-II 1
MKLIIAIIRPERVEAVQGELSRVLDERDTYRLTVDAVEGHGAQRGEAPLFRGQRARPGRVPKARITLGVNEDYVERAVDAIVRGARTGSEGAVGDGKIFVVPLEDCIRIRNGERGSEAI